VEDEEEAAGTCELPPQPAAERSLPPQAAAYEAWILPRPGLRAARHASVQVPMRRRAYVAGRYNQA